MIQSQGIIRAVRAPGAGPERTRATASRTEGKDRHGERLRRDHHRRRTQRAHQRCVLRTLGRADGGTGGPRQDRWRGRHQRAVPGPPRHQGHDVLLRHVPHAAHDHPGAQPQTARLRRHTVRSLLPGVPRRSRDHGVRRRREEELRLDRPVLEEGRGHAPEVGGVAEGRRRRARPAAAAGAAEARLALHRGPGRQRAVRVEDAETRHAWRRRRHTPVHDERERSAGRLVRVRRDQSDAHGERRDRYVGGAGRTGHRVRDAAPLDRRCRRRSPRIVGFPAGRHGRRLRLPSAARQSRSGRRSAPTRA